MIITEGMLHSLLPAGTRASMVYLAWLVTGQNVKETARLLGMEKSMSRVRKDLKRVREVLAHYLPGACAGCREQPARYCIGCLTKAAQRKAAEEVARVKREADEAPAEAEVRRPNPFRLGRRVAFALREVARWTERHVSAPIFGL